MADQPKYKPDQPSPLFTDGRSSRPLEAGTVAQGHLRDDDAQFTGMEPAPVRPAWVVALLAAGNPLGAVSIAAQETTPVDEFPFPITEAVMKRGRERFNIYCAVCHDRTGSGNGKVVQRGYLHPPSYHTDRLRKAPLGHFFNVVTHGYGGMPDYAAQIPPRDRWAIVAYVRALQLSQNARLDDLSKEEQERLLGEKEP
jgi:mono/diheme cytochrome c family protein